MIAMRAGSQKTFTLSQAFLRIVSVQRGLGGGWKIPSGELGMFSLVPKTPM
jgi:hypothetical protein